MFLSNGAPVVAPIDTFGDRTPLLADANYYATSTGIALVGSWAEYSAIYRAQVWVNTVVRKLAFAMARLPYVITAETDTGRMAVPDSPFAQLMAAPAPRLDAFSLWLWTSSTYDVYGEAYWVKLRDSAGRVRQLHPLHPANLTIRRAPDGTLTYHVTAGVRNADLLPGIPESDVVPFRNYNPENLTRGFSNLEPLRQTLLSEDAARRATASWWNKGARPSIMLKHPKRLTDDVVRRLKAQAESRHGGADNVGGAMVLEEGMEAQIVQLTAEEMQYIETRKLNREEVCGAFDVPPPVVHILDKATFSNITEQMRSMYRDTMGNRLPLFESAIDHHLRPEFDPTGVVQGRFDLDGVLRGDFETRASAVVSLIGNGVMKPSEARPLFSLPDAGPTADELYANAALIQLGSRPPAGPTPAPAVDEGPAPQARALYGSETRVRALMSTLGRKDAQEARRTLTEEHTRVMQAFFERQRDHVVGKLGTTTDLAALFDVDSWSADTADALEPLATATAKTAGGSVARSFGARFAVDAVADWLSKNVGSAADGITKTTFGALAAALGQEDPKAALVQLFGDYVSARAAQIAQTRVTAVSNYAGTAAAKVCAKSATKTWRTNNPNARESHAAMDGETVSVHDDFSNGMHYPGDDSADVDEVAGCDCSLDFAGGA